MNDRHGNYLEKKFCMSTVCFFLIQQLNQEKCSNKVCCKCSCNLPFIPKTSYLNLLVPHWCHAPTPNWNLLYACFVKVDNQIKWDRMCLYYSNYLLKKGSFYLLKLIFRKWMVGISGSFPFHAAESHMICTWQQCSASTVVMWFDRNLQWTTTLTAVPFSRSCWM